MHLIMTSRDERVVSQAIYLNEQLHKVLAKHDALLSGQPSSGATFINLNEEDEEEDLDRLLHRRDWLLLQSLQIPRGLIPRDLHMGKTLLESQSEDGLYPIRLHFKSMLVKAPIALLGANASLRR